MIFTPLAIAGAFLVEPDPRVDDRGFFARTWCRREFAEQGLIAELAQISVAYTHRRGTLRGLHYQAEPHAEAKLVRCTQGAAFMVALDLRNESPSFGRWVGIELDPHNRRAMYVPPGCAQGYQTLTDATEILYQMSEFYAPGFGRGVRYNDPAFAVAWPLEPTLMSETDRNWPDFVRTMADSPR